MPTAGHGRGRGSTDLSERGPAMGDIGTERREVEFEPLPREPVAEPVAAPARRVDPAPAPAPAVPMTT